MSSNILAKLANAAIDYRYLLDRGYPQKQSLDLVASRYGLSQEYKLALYRCVHTSELSERVRAKIISLDDVPKYGGIVIDFYNVTLTILAAYLHQPVFLCDDCLVRDVRGSKVKHEERETFMEIVRLLSEVIACYGIERVVVVADRRVSWSAMHIEYLRNLLEKRGVMVSSLLSDRTDSDVLTKARVEGYPVASTDIVVLQRAEALAPLVNTLFTLLRREPSFNFALLFNTSCDHAFNYTKSCIEK